MYICIRYIGKHIYIYIYRDIDRERERDVLGIR